MTYFAKNPILFINFNRPKITKLSFSKIRETKPTRLYISVDGPRASKQGESEKVATVIQNIKDLINWPCDIHWKINKQNLGCKMGVSSAIDWFFEHEDQGIILEDDIIVGDNFFQFIDEGLKHFRDDSKIFMISGANNEYVSKCDSDYFISKAGSVWGWATWKDKWRMFDVNLNGIQPNSLKDKLRANLNNLEYRKQKIIEVERIINGKVDSWAYPMSLYMIMNNLYCLSPKLNLACNYGFDRQATHTGGFRVPLCRYRYTDIIRINPNNELKQYDEYENSFVQRFSPKILYTKFFWSIIKELIFKFVYR